MHTTCIFHTILICTAYMTLIFNLLLCIPADALRDRSKPQLSHRDTSLNLNQPLQASLQLASRYYMHTTCIFHTILICTAYMTLTFNLPLCIQAYALHDRSKPQLYLTDRRDRMTINWHHHWKLICIDST